MSAFSTSRNIELSTIRYIETSIAADWTGITVTKSFSSAYKASLPVVAIELSTVNNDRKEIGSTEIVKECIINIDIFATSSGLRIDLADYIVNKLKDQFPYYIHSQTSGSPETLSRVVDGNVIVRDFISDTKLNFGEQADIYDRNRHFLSIAVRKSS
jgi:hypothetical protein